MPAKRDPAEKQLDLAKKACDRWTELASDESVSARHRRSMAAAVKPLQQLIALMEKSLKRAASGKQSGGAELPVGPDVQLAGTSWSPIGTPDPTAAVSTSTGGDVAPFSLGGMTSIGGLTTSDAGMLLPKLGGAAKKKAPRSKAKRA